MNEQVTMEQIQELCHKYNVEFKISVDKNGLVYHFGPIKWYLNVLETMNLHQLFAIAQRLAATYPEKVLS